MTRSLAWRAILLALIVFWAIVGLAIIQLATPSSAVHVGAERLAVAPFEGRGSRPEHDRLSGASQERDDRPATRGTSAPARHDGGAPLPAGRTVTTERLNPTPAPLKRVTRSGTWAWADPSHGARYLAIPPGPGWTVRACGPSACILRVSTDAGPVLSLQRAGRIGDLSAADFETVCGLSPAQRVIFGLCQGSWTIEGLPETDER